MGNKNSSSLLSPLEQQWDADNIQTFMIKGHKNKIFGCDVIIPDQNNTNELWVASCGADGKLLINEVIIETPQQKHIRQKMLKKINTPTSPSLSNSLNAKSAHSLQSKSYSNVISNTNVKHSSKHLSSSSIKNNKNNKNRIKKYEIEVNRILSISLDSSFCYTISLHPNCRYVSTCIDKVLFIYNIDFNSDSPVFNEIKIAKKYISSAKFINNRHIMFTSGYGYCYLYDFIHQKLVIKIKYNNDIMCADYGILDNTFRFDKKHLICFATFDSKILIYDISAVIQKDYDNKQINVDNDVILIQEMNGHFGSDISCIAISPNSEFIAAGSDDNSYNIYYKSLSNDGSNIKYILLYKQIIINDANINNIAWIDSTTVCASCDKGNVLYLTAMYNVSDNQIKYEIILRSIQSALPLDICKLYSIDIDEFKAIKQDITEIILEYVHWDIKHHKTSVDFDDHISNISVCPNANDGAGIMIVSGFSKVMQCFLSLNNF